MAVRSLASLNDRARIARLILFADPDNRLNRILSAWSDYFANLRITFICARSRCQRRRHLLTLTTHAIVGAAIAGMMPNHPAAGIALAFSSHFLLDAVPHWDYPIRSASLQPKLAAPMKYDITLWRDAIAIGLDASLGLTLALLLFAGRQNLVLVLCGVAAGLLPDVLQFAWMRWPHEPLNSLQRFHQWIHTCHTLEKRPVLGLTSQFLFLAAFLVFMRVIGQT